MNQTFYESFKNTLIVNVATICAVLVGIVNYVYRATSKWYFSGGRTILFNAVANVSVSINKLSEKVYFKIEDAEFS